MHSTQFNVPVVNPAAQITTIYDCVYDRFPEQLRSARARLYYKIAFLKSVPGSATIIVPSIYTRDELKLIHHIPNDRIVVIPLAANEFAEDCLSLSDIEVAGELHQLGLDARRYVLTVGSFRSHKNLVRLVEAFAERDLLADGGLCLVIVGAPGPDFDRVVARRRELNLTERVLLPGFVSERALWALYRGARAVCLPSLLEGFGFVLLEALSVGVPSIAADIPALRELADNASIFVDPRDPHHIASAIARLTTDVELSSTLVAKGRARAREFSWRRVADETSAIYEKFLT